MTTSVKSTTHKASPDVKQQAGMLLEQVAGYVATRTIQLGLQSGLVAALADADEGLTLDELAVEADIDPFYAQVWCRAAVAAGLLQRDGARLRLADHLADLLLTGRGPVRGYGQHPLSNRGSVAGRVGPAAAGGAAMEGLGILVDGRLAGRTDGGGGYTLSNLRPGVYAVSLDPDGLPIDLAPPARPALVEIAAGAVTRLDFELTRSLGMEGVIHDGRGEPANGARLRFLNENAEAAATARSDAFGRWLATGLRPGSYTIQLERDGRWTEIGRETLVDEWLFDIDLVLPNREEKDE